MSKIVRITAREILDSRGNPTVEAEVTTTKSFARASVPNGASTGSNEAYELRDNDTKRFFGKGVHRAVVNVNTKIFRALKGTDVLHQEIVDKKLIEADGTRQKMHLGANALLAVSMACCRAAAFEQQISLAQHIANISGTKKMRMPIPAFNIINGGKHAGNNLDIQEYMVLPVKAKSFQEALRIGAEIYHELKKLLQKDFGKTATNVGDEGGFAPPLTCIEEPFDYIIKASINLGYFDKIKLGIDAAATTFYRIGRYYLEGKEYEPTELLEKYKDLTATYPLISIEDPFFEESFDHFSTLTKKIGKHVQIVGDDLTVTNPERIRRAIVQNSCNALLLKINQIGTITEAIEAGKLAFDHHWNVMVSHRSGETEDNFIADFAVGIGAGQIKSGASCRSERLAKYNQLLRLEEQFGKKAKYGGDF